MKQYASISEIIDSIEFKTYVENRPRPVTSGFPMLDHLLKDGIPKGEISIIFGKSNGMSLIGEFLNSLEN